MDFRIRLFNSGDMGDIVELSLLAWEPVFVAWEQILGSELYPVAIYADWRKSQQEAVEKVCQNSHFTTWVAAVGQKIVGFITYDLNVNNRIGEVHMLAVHPEFQNQGIGTELNLFALQRMKEGGMRLAMLGTGGDEGHAPARRSYEKAGYTGLPLVRYYKAL